MEPSPLIGAGIDTAPPKNRMTAGVAAVDLYENKLDRFDKALVARLLKLVEIGAAAIAVGGFQLQSLPLLFLALGAVAPLANADPPPQPQRQFDVEGHRGTRGLRPENTLAAFGKALQLGVTTSTVAESLRRAIRRMMKDSDA